MVLFAIALLILAIASGAVAWVMFADSKTNGDQRGPGEGRVSSTSLSTSQILNQLDDAPSAPAHPWFAFLKRRTSSFLPDAPTIDTDTVDASAADFLSEAALDASNTEEAKGTAALRMDREPEDLGLAAQNQVLMEQVEALREKNQRVESLLTEKNSELEQLQSQLSSEQKNRKEFNKVKDILDKELKDSKDRNRALQADLANAQAEAESYLRRLKQLEEKDQTEILADQQEGVALKQALAETSRGQEQLASLEDQLRRNEEVIAQQDRRIAELVELLKTAPDQSPISPEIPGGIPAVAGADNPGPVIAAPGNADTAPTDVDPLVSVDSGSGPDPLAGDRRGSESQIDDNPAPEPPKESAPNAGAGEPTAGLGRGAEGTESTENAGAGVNLPPTDGPDAPGADAAGDLQRSAPEDDVARVRKAVEQAGLADEEGDPVASSSQTVGEDIETGSMPPVPETASRGGEDLTPKDLLEKIESGLGDVVPKGQTPPLAEEDGLPGPSSTGTGQDRKNPFSDLKNFLHLPGKEEPEEEPAHLRPDIIGRADDPVPDAEASGQAGGQDLPGEDAAPPPQSPDIHENQDEKKESA